MTESIIHDSSISYGLTTDIGYGAAETRYRRMAMDIPAGAHVGDLLVYFSPQLYTGDPGFTLGIHHLTATEPIIGTSYPVDTQLNPLYWLDHDAPDPFAYIIGCVAIDLSSRLNPDSNIASDDEKWDWEEGEWLLAAGIKFAYFREDAWQGPFQENVPPYRWGTYASATPPSITGFSVGGAGDLLASDSYSVVNRFRQDPAQDQYPDFDADVGTSLGMAIVSKLDYAHVSPDTTATYDIDGEWLGHLPGWPDYAYGHDVPQTSWLDAVAGGVPGVAGQLWVQLGLRDEDWSVVWGGETR